MEKIRMGISFIVMMFSILFNTIDAALIVKAPEPLAEQSLVEMSEKFEKKEYSKAKDYFRVGKGSKITCIADPLKVGKNTAVYRANIYNEEETLISTVTGTFFFLD